MKLHTFLTLLSTLGFIGATQAQEAATIDVHPQASGKAFITINVNGKTETREIQLGNARGEGASTLTLASVHENSVPTLPVTRTWLGVYAETLSEDIRAQINIAEGVGLVIRNVIPDSPAAAVGLQKHDILMKLDDQLLVNSDQFATLVKAHKEGDTVKITYLRKGAESVAEARLVKHTEEAQALTTTSTQTPWANMATTAASGGSFIFPPVQFSRVMVMGKDGQMVSGTSAEEVTKSIEDLEKKLRDAGVEEKVIEETKRSLEQATSGWKKSAETIKEEAQKSAPSWEAPLPAPAPEGRQN